MSSVGIRYLLAIGQNLDWLRILCYAFMVSRQGSIMVCVRADGHNSITENAIGQQAFEGMKGIVI